MFLGSVGKTFSTTSIIMHKNYLLQLSEMGVDIDAWHAASYRTFLAREEELAKHVAFRDSQVM